MSSLFADGIIWLLLLMGVGFSGIGVIGLLLFPDIRSRRYTGFRAALIGLAATGCAVFAYGGYQYAATSGSEYLSLILHALILVIVVFVGNTLVSREILNRAIPKSSCELPEPASTGESGAEN